MMRNEGETLRRVVVCPPGREYVTYDDPRVHNIAEPADLSRAQEQHHRLRETLRLYGADVITVPELPGHPNSVFTRDPLVMTPEGFVKLRMGLPTRRGEETWLAEHLASLGVPEVGRIEPPGTLEGGDVILAGRVAFIGHSSRSNAEGVKQMAEILQRMGYETRIAAVAPRYLHIGGAMSMIAPERVLACSGTFPGDFFKGFDVVEVNSGDFVSGNVICLRPNEVIAEAAQQMVIDRLQAAKVVVHVLDLSEFVKGSGGPTCLILPIERGNWTSGKR